MTDYSKQNWFWVPLRTHLGLCSRSNLFDVPLSCQGPWAPVQLHCLHSHYVFFYIFHLFLCVCSRQGAFICFNTVLCYIVNEVFTVLYFRVKIKVELIFTSSSLDSDYRWYSWGHTLFNTFFLFHFQRFVCSPFFVDSLILYL